MSGVGSFLTKSSWIVLAFVYLADSGLTYRKYTDGRIPASQFYTQTSVLSLSTLGGLLGGAGGTALGFAIGNLIFPGVGGVVGSLVGGVAGGLAGNELMLANYHELELRIEEAKELRD